MLVWYNTNYQRLLNDLAIDENEKPSVLYAYAIVVENL